MGNQKNDAGNSEMSKLIAMIPKIRNNLNSIITSSAKSSIAFAEAKKMEEARLLAKMIISQLKNNSDLSEKTITISPNQDGTDTQLNSLFSWFTTKQEEYNSIKKDIMEGKRDKKQGIATLKLERQNHKTEYENLSKIENKSDYRMYEGQFNKTLFELTDSIITELEEWQSYFLEESIKEDQNKYSPQEIAVMAIYPSFKKDYEVLTKNNYMRKIGDTLQWLRSKQSLSEYFGHQKKPTNWKIIENLFSVKDLKNSFSSNGCNTKGKSLDYIDLMKILK